MRSLRSLGLWPAAGVVAAMALLLLAPAASTDEEATLCAPHGVDTSLCLICDPELREPGRLWCSEPVRR